MSQLSKKEWDLIEQLRISSRKLVQELGLLSIASKEDGLPPSHWHTLIEIERHPKISAKELSSKILLEKSTMSRILKDLKKNGYIGVKKRSDDKRESEISITKKGLQKKVEIDLFSIDLVSGALKNLNSEQIDQVLSGIKIYSQALENSRSLREKFSNFEIFEPKTSDLEALARLHVTVWEESYSTYMPIEMLKEKNYENRLKTWKNILSKKDPQRFLRVVKADSRLVGFVSASVSPREPLGFDAELQAIYLLQEFHKQGIGKKLLTSAFDFCRSHGAKSIYVWVAAKNLSAVAFYTKMGGKKEMSTKVEQGLDHLCFSWAL